MGSRKVTLPPRRRSWSDGDWAAFQAVMRLEGPRAGLLLAQQKIELGRPGARLTLHNQVISEARIASEMFTDAIEAEAQAQRRQIYLTTAVISGVLAIVASLGGVTLGHWLATPSEAPSAQQETPGRLVRSPR